MRSDRPIFSHLYSLSYFGYFYTLASILTSSTSASNIKTSIETSTVTPSSNSNPIDQFLFVDGVLNASKLLKSTNEDENRDINATKAEIFGGFLRGFLVLFETQLKNIPKELIAERNQIELNSVKMENLLVSYFSEIVERLSVDYLKDWAEAVFSVFSCGLCKLGNPLSVFILDGFRRVLRISSVSSTIVSVSSVSTSLNTDNVMDFSGVEMEEITEEMIIVKDKDNSEEGFLKQGKALTLTRAALMGEINASTSYLNNNTTTAQSDTPLGFGQLVAKILSEPDSDFFSPFIICRLEIGKIFSLLSEYGRTDSIDLSAILFKISNAVNAGSGIPHSDDISVDVANVAIVESTVDTGTYIHKLIESKHSIA